MTILNSMRHTAALLIISFCLMPACTARTITPPAPGALAVKILPAVDVRIVQTSARQERGYVIVDGQIKRKKVHARKFPRGHIDITILDEAGKTIHETFTKYSPDILPRIDGVKSSFSAKIAVTVPTESLVVVKFHSGPHGS